MLRVRALAIVLFGAACAQPAADATRDTALAAGAASVDLAAEERAVRDATQRWNRAMTAGDTAAMHGLYADEGVWLLSGMPSPMLNRDSVRAMLKESKFPPDQKQETLRVTVAASGDLAYELGRFGFGGRPGGYYVRVWQKAGGQWRILATAPQPYGQQGAR